MRTLFNDGWKFSELPIADENEMFREGKPVLFTPDQFLSRASSLEYESVILPHDWQIHHVKDLYKNSVGFYKKTFNLTSDQVTGRYNAIRFEGIYMNSAVWVNGKKAGEWKYGYATFEFDISELIHTGENEILVIAVYQNCNTRWYSGAGIYRDVTYISSPAVHLVSDGIYFSAIPEDPSKLNGIWNIRISVEVEGTLCGHKIENEIALPDGKKLAKTESQDFKDYYEVKIENPLLWDVDSPVFYILTTRLLDKNGTAIDEISQHCGFKYAEFTRDKGFFLNGRHLKIHGACHHHDHGALGSAFNRHALRRQFTRLKEMGDNAIRCSHNPPPSAWMDLCDEMGIMVDDEAFDMWEKT